MAAIQTALGNFFGNLVRASKGIFISGTNLNSQTDWIIWTPAFTPATQLTPPSSSVANYRQIADQVYINLNLTFTYTPPGPSSNTVTITGFPVPAAAGAKYSNLCVVDGASVFADVCRLRIDPATSAVAIDIVLGSDFVPATMYTIRGQITYKAGP